MNRYSQKKKRKKRKFTAGRSSSMDCCRSHRNLAKRILFHFIRSITFIKIPNFRAFDLVHQNLNHDGDMWYVLGDVRENWNEIFGFQFLLWTKLIMIIIYFISLEAFFNRSIIHTIKFNWMLFWDEQCSDVFCTKSWYSVFTDSRAIDFWRLCID